MNQSFNDADVATFSRHVFLFHVALLQTRRSLRPTESRNLQPKTLGDFLIITGHWKSKPGQLCDYALLCSKSDASSGRPVGNPAD